MVDPTLERVGVPVEFWPRAENLRQECRLHIGTVERVVAIGGIIDARYPGEVALFHVVPGRLLFGASWVASGDVRVMVDQAMALGRGGAHE